MCWKLNRVNKYLDSGCFSEEQIEDIYAKVCSIRDDMKYYALQVRDSLGPLQGQKAEVLIIDDPHNNIPDQRKEHTMCYNCKSTAAVAAPTVNITAPDTEQEQRRHLVRRLESAYYEKRNKMHDLFYSEDRPKTKTDLIARLKEGKFVFDDDYLKKDGDTLKGWWNLADLISWRLQPVDEAAYSKAMNDLEARFRTDFDTITIASPKEGLDAFRAFEAYMPEGTALQ